MISLSSTSEASRTGEPSSVGAGANARSRKYSENRDLLDSGLPSGTQAGEAPGDFGSYVYLWLGTFSANESKLPLSESTAEVLPRSPAPFAAVVRAAQPPDGTLARQTGLWAGGTPTRVGTHRLAGNQPAHEIHGTAPRSERHEQKDLSEREDFGTHRRDGREDEAIAGRVTEKRRLRETNARESTHGNGSRASAPAPKPRPGDTANGTDEAQADGSPEQKGGTEAAQTDAQAIQNNNAPTVLTATPTSPKDSSESPAAVGAGAANADAANVSEAGERALAATPNQLWTSPARNSLPEHRQSAGVSAQQISPAESAGTRLATPLSASPEETGSFLQPGLRFAAGTPASEAVTGPASSPVADVSGASIGSGGTGEQVAEFSRNVHLETLDQEQNARMVSIRVTANLESDAASEDAGTTCQPVSAGTERQRDLNASTRGAISAISGVFGNESSSTESDRATAFGERISDSTTARGSVSAETARTDTHTAAGEQRANATADSVQGSQPALSALNGASMERPSGSRPALPGASRSGVQFRQADRRPEEMNAAAEEHRLATGIAEDQAAGQGEGSFEASQDRRSCPDPVHPAAGETQPESAGEADRMTPAAAGMAGGQENRQNATSAARQAARTIADASLAEPVDPPELRQSSAGRAARSLVVEVPGQEGADGLRLRFLQRLPGAGGGIDVRISSPSEHTVREMRAGIPALMQRLEDSGFATNASLPGQSSRSPDGGDGDRGGRGNGQPGEHSSRDGQSSQGHQGHAGGSASHGDSRHQRNPHGIPGDGLEVERRASPGWAGNGSFAHAVRHALVDDHAGPRPESK